VGSWIKGTSTPAGGGPKGCRTGGSRAASDAKSRDSVCLGASDRLLRPEVPCIPRRTAGVEQIGAAAAATGDANARRRAVAQAGVRVDRAVSELRRGRLVRLSSGSEDLLVGAIETLQPAAWEELADRATAGDGQRPSVTLTAERAQASGWLRATAAVLADGDVATLGPVGMAGTEPAAVAPI